MPEAELYRPIEREPQRNEKALGQSGLIQWLGHNKTLGVGCKVDNSSYVLVVEDIVGRWQRGNNPENTAL